MRKIIAKWSNGVTKEVEVNRKSEEIIVIAETKMWCDKNHFKYPEFIFEGEYDE